MVMIKCLTGKRRKTKTKKFKAKVKLDRAFSFW